MKTKISFKSFKTAMLDKISIVVLALFLFYSTNIFSQSNQGVSIFERNNYVHILNGNPANLAKIKTMLNLMDGVNSAVYLTNGQQSNYGSNPIVLYSDLTSIGLPVISTIQNFNIEMVTIKIDRQSQLNSIIDFSPFTNFKKLKYIYFRVGFDINLLQLKEAIKNSDNRYVIIYSIDKGA